MQSRIKARIVLSQIKLIVNPWY